MTSIRHLPLLWFQPMSPIIVLTGATSGIGQLAAIELARRGSHLVLTARSEARAAAARAAILAAVPRARIDFHFVDLTNLDSVAAVAGEIASRYDVRVVT